ncbi:MAG: hypothetical protein RL065_37 [Bacteroidota bacterium]|jgi:hypothetical protein
MKLFYSTLFVLLLSSVYAFAQPQMLIGSNYYKKSYPIKEGNKIVVYLKNKVEIEGKFYIVNDSMITVDDTTVNLKTIDFISARVHNTTTVAVVGVTTAVCGLWPITGLYFLYEYGIKPKKLFDLKNDCDVTLLADKRKFSKYNHENHRVKTGF